jgi:hypothetical protein
MFEGLSCKTLVILSPHHLILDGGSIFLLCFCCFTGSAILLGYHVTSILLGYNVSILTAGSVYFYILPLDTVLLLWSLYHDYSVPVGNIPR